MGMSDSESEPEDDPRLMQLTLKSDKVTPEELAAYLKELGGDDALIYGDLMIGFPKASMAHFLLMGAACLNEDGSIAPQLEEKRTLFKAVVACDEEMGAALLVMLELFYFKERPDHLDEFGSTLKVLWERDIVAEEQIESWVNNERALREVIPKHYEFDKAIAIRE